jgi:putative hydrolases of HD superfamily
LIHDLAESIVGDLTPYDPISKEEKSRKEEEAMKEILKELPENIRENVIFIKIKDDKSMV